MAKINPTLLHKIGNKLLDYTYQNPKRNMLRIMKVVKLAVGNMYPETTFTKPVEIISDESNIWHQYLFNGLEDIDREQFKNIALTFAIDAGYVGTSTLRANREKFHCNIPWVILLDPTSACNLRCTGCWAAEYGYKLNLSFEEMDSIVTQGKELGIYFYMFTGGEPLVRKEDIIRLCKKHHDCAFSSYTNGTLIDEEFCKKAVEVGNLSFSISVEGFEETNDFRRGEGTFKRIMHGMDLLKKHGLLFGVSICYTSKNVETVVSDEFIDLLIEKGCKYGWYFNYMPVGKDADPTLIATPEQREYMYHRIREIRGWEGGKQIFVMDFQNDGEYVGGCIAGGRNYFHINANGDAEPCVFIHYSSANIRKDSLIDCLKQPLFMAYRDNQPFNDNHLRPCPMLENPEILQRMVEETGARSTDLEAPEDVHSLCGKCSAYAEAWTPTAERLWGQKEHFAPKYDNHKDRQREYLDTKIGQKAYKKAMGR